MGFPILPAQNFQRPAPPQMVDWAGAFDKITEGIERGIRIRQSLQTIEREKESTKAIAAEAVLKEQEAGLKRETHAMDMRIKGLNSEIKEQEFEANYNDVAVAGRTQQQTNALETARQQSMMLGDAAKARKAIGDNHPDLTALSNDVEDFTDQLDNTTDPAKRMAMINDWQKTRLDPIEKRIGVKVGNLAKFLPPDDPWATLLKNADANNLKKMAVDNMTVYVRVPKDISRDFAPADDALAGIGVPVGTGAGFGGKESWKQTETVMTKVPLTQAIALWKMGVDSEGLETFMNSAPKGEERDELHAFMADRGITQERVAELKAVETSKEVTDLQSKIDFNEKILPQLKGERLVVMKADTDQMKQKLAQLTSQPAAPSSAKPETTKAKLEKVAATTQQEWEQAPEEIKKQVEASVPTFSTSDIAKRIAMRLGEKAIERTAKVNPAYWAYRIGKFELEYGKEKIKQMIADERKAMVDEWKNQETRQRMAE